MIPELLLANPPYGKAGTDITKHIMVDFPEADKAMLGTLSMFKPHTETLAVEVCYLPNNGLKWVNQIIYMAWNGKSVYHKPMNTYVGIDMELPWMDGRTCGMEEYMQPDSSIVSCISVLTKSRSIDIGVKESDYQPTSQSKVARWNWKNEAIPLEEMKGYMFCYCADKKKEALNVVVECCKHGPEGVFYCITRVLRVIGYLTVEKH